MILTASEAAESLIRNNASRASPMSTLEYRDTGAMKALKPTAPAASMPASSAVLSITSPPQSA
ncbi:MAG: hypothetical protein ACLRWP_11355 [Bilophila wadsworthia]